MNDHSSADVNEIVRIMSKLPEFISLDDIKIKHEITHKIAQTLREYYWENTRGSNTGWTIKFKKAGITEDDGKTAIACARRLGIEIS
ncbi:MAG: hypothetical protein ACT4NT_01360 [Nitrososphaerota archaeon]